MSAEGQQSQLRVSLGSDHAGFPLKNIVKEHLEKKGYQVLDFGTFSDESTDYPLYCAPAAQAVVDGSSDLGIVFGGSGQGEQIVANKVKGVRAALCFNELSARLARQHNNANVLALGARLLGVELALSIVDAFLGASFEGGRHQRRLDQISELEQGNTLTPPTR
ncbi:ribose 5-phosphate isomerase B [Ferrithrix thermotolerans DSM 19514]|uniref:Ribose-5-phosphate isomerase B n=1 Tax=Ferrithrix thermotolerans DSM 19514 TaxID=1121881 RepID=A0A1M4S516_9ACTN|nr:ribose 5-phosphate isomerase B [Ferrithrix thermotolerans]SHE27107.1 ribose 5-phosphate isomerase B [Ferrithrix thermotolerans DSM 19514]